MNFTIRGQGIWDAADSFQNYRLNTGVELVGTQVVFNPRNWNDAMPLGDDARAPFAELPSRSNMFA